MDVSVLGEVPKPLVRGDRMDLHSPCILLRGSIEYPWLRGPSSVSPSVFPPAKVSKRNKATREHIIARS